MICRASLMLGFSTCLRKIKNFTARENFYRVGDTPKTFYCVLEVLPAHVKRRPCSVRFGSTAEISGNRAAINLA